MNIARDFDSEIIKSMRKKYTDSFAKYNMLPPHLTSQVSLPPSCQSQPAKTIYKQNDENDQWFYDINDDTKNQPADAIGRRNLGPEFW